MHLDPPIRLSIERWWKKYLAEPKDEVFDRFIAVWLVLLVLARVDENENTGRPSIADDAEARLVRTFFERNWRDIARCLDNCDEKLRTLAVRKGAQMLPSARPIASASATMNDFGAESARPTSLLSTLRPPSVTRREARLSGRIWVRAPLAGE